MVFDCLFCFVDRVFWHAGFEIYIFELLEIVLGLFERQCLKLNSRNVCHILRQILMQRVPIVDTEADRIRQPHVRIRIS